MRLIKFLEQLTQPQTMLRDYLKDEYFETDPHWFWDTISEWLEENHPEVVQAWLKQENVDSVDEVSPDYWHELPQNIKDEFNNEYGEQIRDEMMRNNPAEAPSWMHMGLEKMVTEPTWLVHFSNDADSVAGEGFTQGMYDIERLGLTTYFTDQAKQFGGYNFAFDANSRDANWAAREKKYGGDFVMFNTRGAVSVFHYGDNENQYIIWGEGIDPRNIILVRRSYWGGDNEFEVQVHPSKFRRYGIEKVYTGSYEDVVAWVENNYEQYRKVITGW